MSQLRDEIVIQKIVDKLKKLRAQHDITLEQFYNDTNINISRIESSKANISVSTLSAICKYFKISLSELLKGV